MLLSRLPKMALAVDLSPWSDVTGTTLSGNALMVNPLLEASDGTIYSSTFSNLNRYN